MIKQGNISTGQLFCLLMMSRISMEIIYPTVFSNSPQEVLPMVIISEILCFLLALPLIIYSFHGKGFFCALSSKSKLFGFSSAVLATLLLLCASVRTIIYTSEFVQRNLVSGVSSGVLCLILLLFSLYVVFIGQEASARAGVLFLALATIVTILIVISDIQYMKEYPYSIEFSLSTEELFRSSIVYTMRGGDYLIFAALLPYVNSTTQKSGKTVLLYALFSLVSNVLITIFSQIILRHLYGETDYPFIAAASLGNITLVKRLDVIGAGVWALCAVMRSGIMLLSAVCIIKPLFKKKRNDDTGRAEA